MRSTSHRLSLEVLEARELLSTCYVTRLTDFGAGKGFRGDLRYCIDKVNSEPGPDIIEFRVTGIIALESALPEFTSDVQVLGPGAEQLTVTRAGGTFRIFTVASGSVTIDGMTIANGFADVGGGLYNQGTLVLSNAIVSGSISSSGFGGGIYNAGQLTVQGSLVVGNTASSAVLGFGGGIFNEHGATALVSQSTIRGNVGRNSCQGGGCPDKQTAGAGIYNAVGAQIDIVYSSISENDLLPGWVPTLSVVHGIGLYNAGTARIANSLVARNEMNITVGPDTQGHGGGVYNAGSIEIVNSTIALNQMRVEGNGAKSHGSGLYQASGSAIVVHSTISENSLGCSISGYSDRRGAGIGVFGGTLTAKNSLVAGNFGTGNCHGLFIGPDLYGSLTISLHNLFGVSAGGSDYHPTDILDVNAQLGVLASNGGPTLTYSLLATSPAIDAGDNTGAPEWDQRGPGFPRVVNGTVDIGAFEVQTTNALTIDQNWIDPLTAIALFSDE